MNSELINFLISWGPTILFALIITIATLVGLARGYRKSKILAIHAVIAGAVCLLLYFICVRSKIFDELSLALVNLFMGENGLQNLLNVSTECASLKEVLVEFIPTIVNMNEGMKLVLLENRAYLLALVDLAYSLVFALFFFIQYLSSVFILYIVYLIFYSERKYRRRTNKEFALNQRDSSYRKRPLGGAIIGFARGLVVGVIFLSYLGGALSLVAGNGDKKTEDYDFDNQTVDMGYSIYQSIEEYGSTGIYKVLNSFKDSNDSPYYLFAADLIFSGRLNDPENGIENENIAFRKELAAYTNFAIDTANLLIKYGGEDINNIIASQDQEAIMDTAVTVMKDPEFQEEFGNLIEDFDAQTYIINLTFSLVTSIISNMDELGLTEQIGVDNAEMLKILFKKGYVSSYEQESVKEIRRQKAKNSSLIEGDNVILPYTKVSHLLNKDDILVLYNVLLELLEVDFVQQTEATEGEETENQSQEKTLDLIKQFIPHISELSILSSSKKDEFNPVLTRLYCYIDNRFLTIEGTKGVTYSSLVEENVSWIDEINSLITVATDAIDLYGNIKIEEGQEPLDVILGVFDPETENYEANMTSFNSVVDEIQNSRLIGKVLGTSKMSAIISQSLAGVNEYYSMPENVKYENTYDKDGNLVATGELGQLLNGIKILLKPENQEVLKQLLNTEEETDSMDTISSLTDILYQKDNNEKALVDYVVDSKILTSIISAFVIANNDNEQIPLYVPTNALEKNSAGEYVNIIQKEQIQQLLNSLPTILELVTPLLENEEGIKTEDIVALIENDDIYNLVMTNKVVEGSVSKMLINVFASQDMIVVPASLTTPEAWVSTNTKKGELKNILNFIFDSDLDISLLLNGGENQGEELLDSFMSMSSESIDMLFDSKVLYYSVSNYINSSEMDLGSFKLIVPYSSLINLQDDTIDTLIKEKELKALFIDLISLDLDEGLDINSLLLKISRNKEIVTENNIISASMVNYLVNSDIDMLEIPDDYVSAGTQAELKNYGQHNIWYNEINSLLYALDEALNLSSQEEGFELTEEALKEAIVGLLPSLNDASSIIEGQTRLDVIYDSKIILANITKKLDESLLDSGVVSSSVIMSAKSGGYYHYSELSAISYTANKFDIDLVNIEDTDSLKDKLLDNLFTINDIDETGKSTLDYMYPSIIIMSVFTTQIDDATEGLIEESVKVQIKNTKNIYTKEELSAMLDAFEELGYDDIDFSSTEGLDFNDIETLNDVSTVDPNKTKLQVVYKSLLVAGILTKSLNDHLDNNQDMTIGIVAHKNAYYDNVKVYKEQEVQSLLDIYVSSNQTSIEEFDINKISLEEVKKNVYDEYGNVKSWLLTATFSNYLLTSDETRDIIVPITVYDYNADIIEPYELSLLIDALMALDDGTDDEALVSFNEEIPSPEVREIALESTIMRATITKKILEYGQNKDDEFFVSSNNIIISTDYSTHKEICYVKKQELISLFAALDEMTFVDDSGNISSKDKTFTIPKINIQTIVLNHNAGIMDKLFESEIVTYRMSKTMVKYLSNPGRIEIVNLFLSLDGSGTVDISQEYLFELLSEEFAMTDVVSKDEMILVAKYFANHYA